MKDLVNNQGDRGNNTYELMAYKNDANSWWYLGQNSWQNCIYGQTTRTGYKVSININPTVSGTNSLCIVDAGNGTPLKYQWKDNKNNQ